MCGRMNVTDDPVTKALSEALGISGKRLNYSNDIAPGGKVSIVRDCSGNRLVNDALWWLFLDKDTLKPNYKYASFNSRSDKLNQPRSLAYQPFRSARCIIPASGFVEGLGDKKTYFHLRPEHSAIAFGGLYREWINHQTGELIYSTSIITLPPHKKLESIHPKSIPLMLPLKESGVIERWLDPNFKEVEAFNELLEPVIEQSMVVTPIDKPSKRNAIGEPFLIEKDAA